MFISCLFIFVKRMKSPCLALDIGVKFGECLTLYFGKHWRTMAKYGDRGEIWRPWRNLETAAKFGDRGENWRPARLDYDSGSSLGGLAARTARRLERLGGTAARRHGGYVEL